MKNSWGQTLKVGSLVYRGARQGNSSEYKVGLVESLKPGKGPRIRWKYEASIEWVRIDGEQIRVPSIWKIDSAGSPSLESLMVVDLDIEELERQAQFYKSFDGNVNFSSMQEFENALETFRL